MMGLAYEEGAREILPIELPPELREADRLLDAFMSHCVAHGLPACAAVGFQDSDRFTSPVASNGTYRDVKHLATRICVQALDTGSDFPVKR